MLPSTSINFSLIYFNGLETLCIKTQETSELFKCLEKGIFQGELIVSSGMVLRKKVFQEGISLSGLFD